MADELLPNQEAAGGPGGPRTGIADTGVDYRRVQQPVDMLQPWRLPSNGSAEKASALAGLFKDFSGVTGQIAQKVQTKAGAIAGAAAGATGTPGYKEGLLQFNAYNTAYNNAATRSYLIQSEAHAESTVSTLQVNAAKDPALFTQTATAARDAALKETPEQAKAEVMDAWNRRIAQGTATISAQQASDVLTHNQGVLDQGIGLSVNKIAKLHAQAAAGDATAWDQGADELAKMTAMINGAVNDHTISATDGAARLVLANKQIFSDTTRAMLQRELQTNPNPLAGIQFIQKFQKANADNPTLSEAEEKKLTADMFTDLKEYNLMVHGTQYQVKTAEQQRYEEGDKLATSLYLRGKLTTTTLGNLVDSNDLKSERATSLSQLLRQDPATRNPYARLKLQNDKNFPDMTDDEIIRTPGLSAEDAQKAIAERDKRNSSYEGTQEYKDGLKNIELSLKIPPGTPTSMLTDDQKRQQSDALLDYRQQMQAADPAQRHMLADSISKKVIAASQARIAAQELTALETARANFDKNYGPGTSDYNESAYKDRLAGLDARIKAMKQKTGAQQ